MAFVGRWLLYREELERILLVGKSCGCSREVENKHGILLVIFTGSSRQELLVGYACLIGTLVKVIVLVINIKQTPIFCLHPQH